MTEDVSETEPVDILLFSSKPGPRAFVLGDKDDTNFMAVLLEETEDSFLLTLPAIVILRDGVKTVEPYIRDQVYLRLLKSNVKWVMFLRPEYSNMYSKYIKTTTTEQYEQKSTEELTEKLAEVVQHGGLVFDTKGSKH
jgi:hypothetical protein